MNVRIEVETLEQAGEMAKTLALNAYRVYIIEGKRIGSIFNPTVIFIIIDIPDEDIVSDTATWDGLA
jgi:hypothetical protein